VPTLINAAYGASFAWSGFEATKNFCCTGWTHGGAVVASDVIILDDTRQIATGETLGELADEVEYLAGFGWMPVGDVYEMESDDGRVYAQDMVNGN
jgi:hypothetical protein